MGVTDKQWMALAYKQAVDARDRGEVPVGAVLISSANQLIAVAGNAVIGLQDPTAHAEVQVIRAAALQLSQYRLTDTTLYTTLEPCPMCAGAIVQARIKRLVFACRDFKAGAAGSVCNLLRGHPWNHSVIIDEGILEQATSLLLKNFFQARRL